MVHFIFDIFHNRVLLCIPFFYEGITRIN